MNSGRLSKLIRVENYTPDQVEMFILDCKEEEKYSEFPSSGINAVHLETIWRMNFYRYWTELLWTKQTN